MKTIHIFHEKSSLITLRFRNKETEAGFRIYYFNKHLWQLRLAHYLAMFFFVIAFYAENSVLEIEKQFVFIIMSVVIGSFITGLMITYFFKDFYRRVYQALNVYYVLIASAAFIILGCTIDDSPVKYSLYSSLFVGLMFNFTFIRHFSFSASITGFVVLLAFNMTVFSRATSSEYLVLLSILLLVAQFLGMFIAYTLELDSRKEYLMFKKIRLDSAEIIEANESLESKIEDRTKELILAKDKAEQSDKLKSAFLANMSHEIRTPMNGILGFLDLMGSSELTMEERAEYMEIIRRSGDRLLATINDIIEISKIEAGDLDIYKEEFDVIDNLKYLFELFAPEAHAKGLEWKLDVPDGLDSLIINSDGNKIEGIMINLIKNALKFTYEGHVYFGFTMSQNAIRLFVGDTGVGISESQIEAIFDRFRQADLDITRNHEGSGLGLPICQAYAEKLGSKIMVESVYGKGSCFYLFLDIDPE